MTTKLYDCIVCPELRQPQSSVVIRFRREALMYICSEGHSVPSAFHLTNYKPQKLTAGWGTVRISASAVRNMYASEQNR